MKKFQKIEKSLELPLGLLKGYYIEIFSGKEITLTGDAEIIEFEDTVLKIRCGAHYINFLGDKITISSYTNGGITINGNISGIEFLNSEDKNDTFINK